MTSNIRQISLDTETTGLEHEKGDRIIEIGCIELINRKITNNTFHTYINPERKISKNAGRITGITNDFLKDKPKFKDIANNFLNFISDTNTIIIHNANFDINFINNELLMINHKIKDIKKHFTIFDTLNFARKIHPGKKNNLNILCKRYNINTQKRKLHSALLDANLLAKLFLEMTYEQINIKYTKKNIKERKNIQSNILKANKYEIKSHLKYLNKLKNDKYN